MCSKEIEMVQAHATERTDRPEKVVFSTIERAAIRDQLQRILEDPLFKTSRRYPSVLKYIVQRALDGSQDGHLKERTIGVEVLGRDPDYDTNEDPTVRVVAGEIRKRLISYYLQPGHASETRIELPLGSYTPKFAIGQPSDSSTPLKSNSKRNKLWTIAGAALMLALLVFSALRFIPSKTALDRFWDPVLRGSPQVLLAVGARAAWGAPPTLDDPLAQRVDPPSTQLEDSGSANDMHRFISTQPQVSLMTAIAMSEVAAFLKTRANVEPIRPANATTLADLRQGSAVLIGSYNNYWTMHLNVDARYRFKTNSEESMSWIEDRDNPSKRDWLIKLSDPYTDVTREYGIISRVADASTGHYVVSVGGLTPIGTVAASEFLVNTSDWDSIARQAPKGWENMNLQVVIGVNLVHGNSGPPSVLATYFW
jgi:hypothetical protein